MGLQHLVDAEAIFIEIFHSEHQAINLKETFLLKCKQEWISRTLSSFLFSVLHGGYSVRTLLDIIVTLNQEGSLAKIKHLTLAHFVFVKIIFYLFLISDRCIWLKIQKTQKEVDISGLMMIASTSSFFHKLSPNKNKTQTSKVDIIYTQGYWIPSRGWEDPLEQKMVTCSSILAWKNSMDRRAWWATFQRVEKSRHD